MDPNDIIISEPELARCIEFARNSAPTQQDIEFGQADIEARSVEEVSRDTLIGKIAEVAFSKLMHENYGIDLEIDFGIYPRGVYDAQDAVVNDWRIDVKGTRQGGRYLLIEWNKLDFRQIENRLSHVYTMFSVGWDRNEDVPNRHVSYAGAVTLRGLAENLNWINTLVLRKGDYIPNTRTILQADNYGIRFDNLNHNLDGLVRKMRNSRPPLEMTASYQNPYTYETTTDIIRSEDSKEAHRQQVLELKRRWLERLRQ